tara:strand:+ start:891 stop:1319 length:429 start_codon:yes stop_codon:yes gene_type:complete
MYILDGQETVHKRDVYNFLFVLADLGGVQLIVTIIISYITQVANNRKSMFSILKKFFMIKSNDPYALPHKYHIGKNVYLYKLRADQKKTGCLYFFSCFGMTPFCTKEHRKFARLLEHGEEKLHQYVNARSMMSILNEHHRVL